MAPADAPKVTMVIRVSKRRTSSSSTKTAPPMGALNAVARPAPAPAARSIWQSSSWRRKSFPTRWAVLAPICTIGPSRPSARPEPIASTPPTNFTDIRRYTAFTGIRRYCARGSSPLSTASTWGMPLPDACGEYRRTSQAATPVAAAQMAITKKRPTKLSACIRSINTLRQRSA